MHRHSRTPSPALVLALLAVFLLGGGVATGASKLIDGKNIKKGSIPYSALSKSAIKSLAADELWAVVAADGSLVRHSGAASARLMDTGRYEVAFSRSIAKCAVAASIGEPGVAADTPAGIIAHRRLTDTTVAVDAADLSNNYRAVPFHLLVLC
jgi:hypothetical protein